ncbi:hypothetical protein ABBQ38_006065 [Trebouxia sp. C0009 RCD-2024]
MNGMLPVWDFSLPEFDQLQDQTELLWKLEPEMADVMTTAPAQAPVQVAGPNVFRSSFGFSGNTTQLRDEPSWERSFAAMSQNRNHALSGQAHGPSTQDSLLPTPCPGDTAVEDAANAPLELQQRQRTGSSDSTERSKAVNRESQRRFRLRQKARSQAVEAQLASTTAELRELKSRQHQLEVRNMLLEKVAQLNKKDSSQSSEDGSAHDAFDTSLTFEEVDIDNVNQLMVSVQGKRYSITPHEVSQMSLQSFSALWTVYICELGRCLLKLKDSADPTLEVRMRELTLEAIALVGHRLLRNPASHKDLASGQMNQDQAAQHKLDAIFYKNLLSLLALTGNQVQDLMLMRQLYLTKRGLLVMECKALVNQMASSDGTMPHPSDNITRMADLATCLKENAAEEHHVYRKIVRAVYRGVLTTKQLAEMMVHCYPYVPSMEAFIHSVAAEEGHPSMDDVVAAAQTNHMEAEWRQFNEYAKYAASDIFHDHLPFLKRRTAVASGSLSSSRSAEILPADHSRYMLI